MDIRKITIPVSQISEISDIRYHEKGQYAYYIITTTAKKTHKVTIGLKGLESIKPEIVKKTTIEKAKHSWKKLVELVGTAIQIYPDR